MSIPFSNTNYRIPRGFANLLEGLTREVLRQQPHDIPLFAAKYFAGILQKRDESGFDPAEWGASLEDRYYNNHSFQHHEDTSQMSDRRESSPAMDRSVDVQHRPDLASSVHLYEEKHELAEESGITSRTDKIDSSITPYNTTDIQPPQDHVSPAEEEHKEQQIQAVTVIQAGLRGHLARQEAKKLREPAAALSISEESSSHPLSEVTGDRGTHITVEPENRIPGEDTEAPSAISEPESLVLEDTEPPSTTSEPESLVPEDTGPPSATSDPHSLVPEDTGPPSTTSDPHSLVPEDTKPPSATSEPENLVPKDTEPPSTTSKPENLVLEDTQPPSASSEPENLVAENTEHPSASSEPESLVPDDTEPPSATSEPESHLQQEHQPTEDQLTVTDREVLTTEAQMTTEENSGDHTEENEACRKQPEEALDIALDDPDANAAAAKIQAGFRGHMTRKKMKSGDKDVKHKDDKDGSAQGEHEGD